MDINLSIIDNIAITEYFNIQRRWNLNLFVTFDTPSGIQEYFGLEDIKNSRYTVATAYQRGITNDGTNIIVGATSSKILKFVGAMQSIDSSFSSAGPAGLVWDGTNLICCDASTKVRKYSGFSGSVLDSLTMDYNVQSVAWDGTNLYGLKNINANLQRIYKYDGFSTTVLDSHDLSNSAYLITSLIFSNNLFYGISTAVTRRILKFAWGGATSTVETYGAVGGKTPVFKGITFMKDLFNPVIRMRSESDNWSEAPYDSIVCTENVNISIDSGLNIVKYDDINITEYNNRTVDPRYDLILVLSGAVRTKRYKGFSTTKRNSQPGRFLGICTTGLDSSDIIAVDYENSRKYIKYDGFTKVILDSFTLSFNGKGIAWDGDNVLTSDSSLKKFYKLEGFSNTISDSFTVAYAMNGISWDEVNMAMVMADNVSPSKIYKFDGFSSSIIDSFTCASGNNAAFLAYDEYGNLITNVSKTIKYQGFSNTILSSLSVSMSASGVAWLNADVKEDLWLIMDDSNFLRDDITKTEWVSLAFSIINFSIYDSISISEDLNINVIESAISLSKYDDVNISEFVELSLDAYNLFNYDSISISEDASLYKTIINLLSYDDIIIDEYVEHTQEYGTITLSKFDDIAILEDADVVVEITIFSIDVYQDILVEEYLNLGDGLYFIELYEDISVVESPLLNDLIIELGIVEENTSIDEYIYPFLDVLNFLIIDDISIVEDFEGLDLILELEVHDDISIFDFFDLLLDNLNFEIFDDVVIIEYVNLIDLVIELSIDEQIFIQENLNLFLDVLSINEYESISIDEYIDVSLPSLVTDMYDDINIVEDILMYVPMDIDVFELLSISEFVNFGFSILTIQVEDNISIVEDFEGLDLAIELEVYEDIVVDEYFSNSPIIDVNVFDEIEAIEFVSINDIVIELGIYENISVNEYLTIRPPVYDFNLFLRGYPYIQTSQARVDRISFENGVEQVIDRWGRTREQFDIVFPVSTKNEALPIKDFFQDMIGEPFIFTSPVDGLDYEVMILDDSYALERRHYNTYFAKISLQEVF